MALCLMVVVHKNVGNDALLRHGRVSMKGLYALLRHGRYILPCCFITALFLSACAEQKIEANKKQIDLTTANDMLKQENKDKQITDDELRAGEAKVQQLTTDHIERVDKVLAAKEAEIMEV